MDTHSATGQHTVSTKMVLYEWVPFNKQSPRRFSHAKLVRDFLESQWPTAYRDTSATENPSENVLKPFSLKADIGWGVSYKHFRSAEEMGKKCTITAYRDDKYNDFPEEKYSHGSARKQRVYVCVDMTYRFTNNVTKFDSDAEWPIQFEGNISMIENILSDVSCMESLGVHYVFPSRVIMADRYADEEIFLDRIGRDTDTSQLGGDNDVYWVYRRIFALETFESIKGY